MVMAVPVYYTAEMVRALPDDGNRYEVVHGELLVTPSPRRLHQRLIRRLLVALNAYLEGELVGEVLTAPADISWAPDILVQPDIFVAPLPETSADNWASIRHLLLVAEVLSPSTARADRFAKRVAYQEAGFPLYWIVDGDQRVIEVWTADAIVPVIERDRVVWHPHGAGQAFVLELRDLFRPV